MGILYIKGGNTIYSFSLFMVSILPGILWVIYFYRKDKYDPEPKYLIVKDFLWGMIAVFPASYLEAPFGDLLSPGTPVLILLLSTIFIVGLIEEGAKALVVYILHYDHHEFNEPLDGIIYGISVGLGFAAFENLFYTMMYGYRVGLIRGVLTTLAHAAFTGIFGYYLGQAKMKEKTGFIFAGFALVTLLHGIYNFLVIGGFIGIVYTVIIVLILQLYLAGLINKTAADSPFKN